MSFLQTRRWMPLHGQYKLKHTAKHLVESSQELFIGTPSATLRTFEGVVVETEERTRANGERVRAPSNAISYN